jgi:hypothetical protein
MIHLLILWGIGHGHYHRFLCRQHGPLEKILVSPIPTLLAVGTWLELPVHCPLAFHPSLLDEKSRQKDKSKRLAECAWDDDTVESWAVAAI